jgi:hypothetical protein
LLFVLVLFASSMVFPVTGSVFKAVSSNTSSGASLMIAPGPGGSAVTELYAVYNERADLQSAFSNAHTNLTNFTKLVNWAEGVVQGQWTDPAYSVLAPFGYYYAVMATYNDQADLQAAFPHAYTHFASFAGLVDWAGGVVTGQSADPAYSVLAPFAYWYALITTYNERPDLQSAFPHASTNLTNYTELVGWAGGVVTVQWTDPAYVALAPFGYYYALMTTYNERVDLQAAFPDAYTSFGSYTGLVSWAGGVVIGQWTDPAYSTLAPFGYFYALMLAYDAGTNPQTTYPDAYTNFGSYTGLVSWAGGVVAGPSTGPSYSDLAPCGYYYALMTTYNDRVDLQAAFPDAYTSFASYPELVNWAAWVADTAGDPAYLVLAPFGYYYNLMFVYDGRVDLQTAFPLASTDWAEEQALASWAGAVVNGTILDSSEATLQPYGYWYVLFGWVYEQRTDLQAQYPMAWTDGASNQGLLDWADAVVSGQISDRAYATLLPFAGTYEALG